ncbi:MAG: ABC transporter [Chloroflexi bacterium]|nr:MAG: ABC transporter [Chloroflexota bacterium]
MSAVPARARTGAVALSLRPATHLFHRNWLVYKRIWYRSLFFGFLQPFMFLAAMGLGVGALLARSNPTAFGPVGYIGFLGPGLLGATVMQTASFESTYPIMNKIMWGRNYEAILSSPLSTRNIVLGELGWIAFRIASIATIFLTVLVIFGIARSPLAVLAIPVAGLTGLGFASWLIAFASTQLNDIGFSWVYRFVINPLFLFSGTFFPLTQMPQAVQVFAWLTPLFHGVELLRGLILGSLDLGTAPWHLAYLLAFFGIGLLLADRSLARRLAS